MILQSTFDGPGWQVFVLLLERESPVMFWSVAPKSVYETCLDWVVSESLIYAMSSPSFQRLQAAPSHSSSQSHRHCSMLHVPFSEHAAGQHSTADDVVTFAAPEISQAVPEKESSHSQMPFTHAPWPEQSDGHCGAAVSHAGPL